jgi:hypothetical protein
LSTKPIVAQDAIEAAKRLQEDVEAFVVEAKSQGPTAALLQRGRELRRRLSEQDSTSNRLQAVEDGISTAFRVRTGRSPENGDLIQPEDDALGAEIARALLAKPADGGLSN